VSAYCLDTTAANLIVFLETYSWITLYPINPISLQKFRETFVTSAPRTTARTLSTWTELLLSHHDKLKPWQPETARLVNFKQLVLHRRAPSWTNAPA